jgi:plasmid stabilization system protein ParE
MPERNAAKPLEWLPSAQAAYLETLEYVSRDDEQAARLIAQRVEKSLAAIQAMPLMGTPTAAPGVRRYPVPNTGHVINYRIMGKRILVQRWYRARRQS